MSSKRTRSLALTSIVVLLLGLGLAACGGGDDDAAPATTTTAAPETTTTTAVAFDPGEGTDTTSAEGDQRAAIEDFMSSVQSDTQAEATGETYTFASISDETGQLTVEAPTEWSDVDGRVATLGNLELPDLRASTDMEAYNSTYDVPGFEFRATDETTTGDPRAVLAEYAARTSQGCAEDLGVQGYSDPLYSGVSQVFASCGDSGAAFVWTVVQPIDTSDGDYIAVVGVQILSDADIEALGHILDTFVVTPAG
jgi:hypothetical protein